MVEKILVHLKANGWSADNIAFGSGGTSPIINPCSRTNPFVAFSYIRDEITLSTSVNRDGFVLCPQRFHDSSYYPLTQVHYCKR